MTGHTITVLQWSCKHPKAVVHISHGLSEHAHRYHELATKLNDAGFEVFAHNHRGHGTDSEPSMFFSDQRGWDKVVDDLELIFQHIKQEMPDKPLFLLGHSMGSYILQSYLMNYASDGIHGCILSGSTF